MTADLDSWGQNWSRMGWMVKSHNFDIILRFFITTQLIILNWLQVSGTNDHVRFSDDLHLYIVYLNSLTTPLLSQSHYIANYSYPKRMLVCPFISNKQTGFLSARLDIERWLTTETYDCMISKVLRPSEKPLIRSLHLLVSVCMSIYVSLCE